MFLLTVPDKGEIPKCQFVAGVLIFSERWILDWIYCRIFKALSSGHLFICRGRNRAIWHVIKVKHENSKYGNATIGNGLPALRCILSFCIDKVVDWVRNPDKKNHADIGAAIAAEHICLAVAVQGLGSWWGYNFDPDGWNLDCSYRMAGACRDHLPGVCKRFPACVSVRKPVNEIVTVL